MGVFNLRTHELCELYELGTLGISILYFTNSSVCKLEFIICELRFIKISNLRTGFGFIVRKIDFASKDANSSTFTSKSDVELIQTICYFSTIKSYINSIS